MRPPSGTTSAIAWLGGVAFVGSLTFFLYAYYVRMGQPAARSGALHTAQAVVVNVGLFGVFALHHSLLARSRAKRWLVSWVDPRLERSLYVWVASVLFVLVCWGWQPLAGSVYRQTGILAVLHWMVVLAGIWITLQSAGVLEPLELAGIRQARGDLRPSAFRVRGPYRLVRHPIYLGWVLMVFGVPDLSWTRLLFATVSSAYLVIAVPFEERSLVNAFGAEYRNYQQTVRWRLVPGVW